MPEKCVCSWFCELKQKTVTGQCQSHLKGLAISLVGLAADIPEADSATSEG